MTISTSTSRADYSGNGSTTGFVVPFYFLANSHIEVVKTTSAGVSTTLTLGVDYTVTGAGVSSGGSITTTTAPASGEKISILRNVPFTQEVDYQANDPFPAETHERALDKLTMQAQQLNENVGRAVTLPVSTTGVSSELPTPSFSKGLKWAADGLSLVNTSYDPDQSVLAAVGSANDAAASAYSAANSAANASSSLATFKGIFYGAYSADPTLDPNGNAMGAGDLYFNSSTLKLRIYSGTSWQDTAVATPASFTSNLFSGNASTTAFTLSSTPASLASVFVFISGVAQRPTTDYTISGNTLTFVSAPPTGTNNISVYVASTVAAGTPDNGSVSTVKIQDAAVTPAKLSTGGPSWDTSGNLTTAGTHADNKGEVRLIPQNAQTASYVLVVSDHGKHISIATGGVTVPASVFSIGQSVVIFNNSAAAQTITQGASATLYNGNDGTSGNRTLGARGLATILCVAANTFVISGAGLT